VTDNGSPGPWVELTVPGTGATEKIFKAPEWLMRGPGSSCDNDNKRDPNIRPAAVVHCVGKNPDCLYPKMWRPGAKPEGYGSSGARRRLGELWSQAVRGAGRLARRGRGGGRGGGDGDGGRDDGFVLVQSWDWIVATLGVGGIEGDGADELRGGMVFERHRHRIEV
jgi:hypothetical protein